MTAKQILNKIKKMGLSAQDLYYFSQEDRDSLCGEDEEYNFDDLFREFGYTTQILDTTEYDFDDSLSRTVVVNFPEHGNVHIRFMGSYSESNGTEWNDDDIVEVFPNEVKIVKYETPKETKERFKEEKKVSRK